MKFVALLTGFAMVGLVMVGDASLKVINPSLVGVATAAETKQSGTSAPEKIALIAKNKSQISHDFRIQRSEVNPAV